MALETDYLHRAERDAYERYLRVKAVFFKHPDLVDAARAIWTDRKQALENCISSPSIKAPELSVQSSR
jgi:hypothetical protein